MTDDMKEEPKQESAEDPKVWREIVRPIEDIQCPNCHVTMIAFGMTAYCSDCHKYFREMKICLKCKKEYDSRIKMCMACAPKATFECSRCHKVQVTIESSKDVGIKYIPCNTPGCKGKMMRVE